MKKIIILAVLILWPISSFATPSISGISGTLTDGHTGVAISGTGFGANSSIASGYIKSLAGINGYIEGRATGDLASMPTGWSYYGTITNVRQAPEISTTLHHSGTKSIKAFKAASAEYYSAFWYDAGAGGFPSNTIYSTWWVNPQFVVNDSDNSQWKLWRCKHDYEMGDQPNDTYCNKYVNLAGTGWSNSMLFNYCNTTTAGLAVCYGDGGTSTAPRYPPNTFLPGEWTRFEVFIVESTSGAQNGTMIYRTVNASHGTTTIYNWVGNIRTRSTTDLRRYFMWSNTFGPGLTTANIYIDDPFVQLGSQARVEIGNAATFTACTAREIQQPTVWNADGTAITFTINFGAFTPGSTPYLFVIDATGTASSGYPIELGGTVSDTTAPAVSNLTPANNAADIANNALIVYDVTDAGTGVDSATIVETVKIGGVDKAGTWATTTIASGFRRSFTPTTAYAYEAQVDLTINASDNVPNAMAQSVTHFHVEAAPNEGTSPSISGFSPTNGAVNINKTSSAIFHLTDAESGVKLSSISVYCEGVDVTSSCMITGTPADYTVTYSPPNGWASNQEVNFVVSCTDELLNALTNSAYTFTVTNYSTTAIKPTTPSGLSVQKAVSGGISLQH